MPLNRRDFLKALSGVVAGAALPVPAPAAPEPTAAPLPTVGPGAAVTPPVPAFGDRWPDMLDDTEDAEDEDELGDEGEGDEDEEDDDRDDAPYTTYPTLHGINPCIFVNNEFMPNVRGYTLELSVFHTGDVVKAVGGTFRFTCLSHPGQMIPSLTRVQVWIQPYKDDAGLYIAFPAKLIGVSEEGTVGSLAWTEYTLSAGDVTVEGFSL